MINNARGAGKSRFCAHIIQQKLNLTKCAINITFNDTLEFDLEEFKKKSPEEVVNCDRKLEVEFFLRVFFSYFFHETYRDNFATFHKKWQHLMPPDYNCLFEVIAADWKRNNSGTELVWNRLPIFISIDEVQLLGEEFCRILLQNIKKFAYSDKYVLFPLFVTLSPKIFAEKREGKIFSSTGVEWIDLRPLNPNESFEIAEYAKFVELDHIDKLLILHCAGNPRRLLTILAFLRKEKEKGGKEEEKKKEKEGGKKKREKEGELKEKEFVNNSVVSAEKYESVVRKLKLDLPTTFHWLQSPILQELVPVTKSFNERDQAKDRSFATPASYFIDGIFFSEGLEQKEKLCDPEVKLHFYTTPLILFSFGLQPCEDVHDKMTSHVKSLLKEMLTCQTDIQAKKLEKFCAHFLSLRGSLHCFLGRKQIDLQQLFIEAENLFSHLPNLPTISITKPFFTTQLNELSDLKHIEEGVFYMTPGTGPGADAVDIFLFSKDTNQEPLFLLIDVTFGEQHMVGLSSKKKFQVKSKQGIVQDKIFNKLIPKVPSARDKKPKEKSPLQSFIEACNSSLKSENTIVIFLLSFFKLKGNLKAHMTKENTHLVLISGASLRDTFWGNEREEKGKYGEAEHAMRELVKSFHNCKTFKYIFGKSLYPLLEFLMPPESVDN